MSLTDQPLETVRNQVHALFGNRARLMRYTTLFVQIALVIFGSGIATGAAVLAGVKDGAVGALELTAISGAGLAALGGIFAVVTQGDATTILEQARIAIASAERAQREADRAKRALPFYEQAITRLNNLYAGVNAARELFERVTTQKSLDEEALVKLAVKATERQFRISMGFGLADVWTICVHRTEENGKGDLVLRCIAHHRSIDCKLEDARSWPLGVGVAGMALAKNAEQVAPDMADPSLGTLLDLPDTLHRPNDQDRYGSMFAVPVLIGSDDLPWGTVIATSSVPNHFGGDGALGLPPEETVRALAGIVALAVALCRENANNVEQGSGALEGASKGH